MSMIHSKWPMPMITILILILAATGCSVASPTLQDTQELGLQVTASGRFFIDAGAGSLTVNGSSTAQAIRVGTEIYQVEPHDDYTLTLEADEDGVARLVAKTEGFNNDYIDLTISVPESLQLIINDSSGSITVRDLANDLNIDDGSGSITISRIGGAVTMNDGSGSIRADRIAGSLDIEDGSGSITANDIGAAVAINDGSGSITVRDAGGVVTVSDGSGSITVNGAADFELLDDSSGSVNLSDIRAHNAGDR